MNLWRSLVQLPVQRRTAFTAHFAWDLVHSYFENLSMFRVLLATAGACCLSACCQALLKRLCFTFRCDLPWGSGRLVGSPPGFSRPNTSSSPSNLGGLWWESPQFASKITFDCKLSRTVHLKKTVGISGWELWSSLVVVMVGYGANLSRYWLQPIDQLWPGAVQECFMDFCFYSKKRLLTAVGLLSVSVNWWDVLF